MSEDFKPLSQAQLKHLRTRLYAAQSRLEREEREEEPAAIKAARKKIKAWESSQWKASDANRARIRKAAQKVEESFLFSGQEKALAALQAFESGKI